MNSIKKDPNSTVSGDYIIVNDAGETIAIIAKVLSNKGYKKFIRNNVTGEWFNPQCFSWFPTLKAVKHYYGIK